MRTEIEIDYRGDLGDFGAGSSKFRPSLTETNAGYVLGLGRLTIHLTNRQMAELREMICPKEDRDQPT